MHLNPRLASLVLFLIVLGIFQPALRNGFVDYDDPEYVTSNARVQRGLDGPGILWAFSNSQAANWHPLTWISHMMDCQLFGLSPQGHHLTNVLIHALNTVLIFLIFQRMTGAPWTSLFIAALFGLHPLRVQSVAWVSERKDVLSGLFWFLTFYAYVRYVEASKRRLGTGVMASPRTWYMVALLCFALGLMAKPMIVTLPFVLLLLDYWPLGRFSWPTAASGSVAPGAQSAPERRTRQQTADALWLFREKLPFFGLAAGLSAVTFLIQNRAGAVVQGYALSARVANAWVSYCRYIGKLFWPVDLAVFYPPVDWAWPMVLLSLMVLLAVTAGVVSAGRRYPWLITGWFWFLGVLVPVIGFVQAGEQSMADRYSYIPSIGLVICFVYGVWEALQRYKRSIGITALAAVTFLCAALTRKEIKYWKDTETLFARAVQVTDKNYLAQSSLGTALEKQGRLEEALYHLQQALAVRPGYAEAHNNLGVVLSKQGRTDEAVQEFARAMELKPGYADPHNNLGIVSDKLGRPEEAIRHYQAALKLKPEFADAHYNLGVALGRKGSLDDAIREFETALTLQPNSADVHNNLAVTLARKGDVDGAIQHYREAIQINPEYATAHFNLGVSLANNGRVDEAIVEFQEALRLRPSYVEAQKNLSALLAARQGPGNK